MTEEQFFKLKLAEAVESNVPVNSNYEAIRKKYSKETSQEKARAEQALNGASDAEVKAVMDRLNI